AWRVSIVRGLLWRAVSCFLGTGRPARGVRPAPTRVGGGGGGGGCAGADLIVCPLPVPPPQAGEGTLWHEPSRMRVRAFWLRPYGDCLRQPRLRQALGDAREIAWVFVGQNTLALLEREIGVDLHELRPHRARLLDAREMAVASGEHHAA